MRRLLIALIAIVAIPGLAPAEDLALCRQGQKAKDSGDNPLAVELYSFCINRGKLGTRALADAYYNRGEAQRRMGKLGAALGDFSAAIRARFDMTEAYIGRAITFAQAGKHGMAIVDYDRALLAEPKAPNLYYNRALSHIGNADYDHALRDLDKVLELDPNFLGAVQYNRGIVFARLRLYDQAMRAFDYSIQRRWQLAIAYHDRGLLFLRNRNFRESYTDFSNALILKPNFGDAFAYRGLAREGLLDKAGAIADYRKALDYGTTLEWVHQRLGPTGSRG